MLLGIGLLRISIALSPHKQSNFLSAFLFTAPEKTSTVGKVAIDIAKIVLFSFVFNWSFSFFKVAYYSFDGV